MYKENIDRFISELNKRMASMTPEERRRVFGNTAMLKINGVIKVKTKEYTKPKKDRNK